jgi:hypothetical protein
MSSLFMFAFLFLLIAVPTNSDSVVSSIAHALHLHITGRSR